MISFPEEFETETGEGEKLAFGVLRRTEDKLTVCTAEGQVQEHILKLVKLGTKWAQGWLCRGAAFAAAVKSRAPHLVNDLLSPS